MNPAIMLQLLCSADGRVAQQVMTCAHEPVGVPPPLLPPALHWLAQEPDRAIVPHCPAVIWQVLHADDTVHLPEQLMSPGWHAHAQL